MYFYRCGFFLYSLIIHVYTQSVYICNFCSGSQDEISVIGSRCRLRGSNPLCPEDIIDPQPTLNIGAADNVSNSKLLCVDLQMAVLPELLSNV